MRLNINPDQSIAFIGDIHCDTVAPSSRTDLDYMKTLKNKMMSILARCKEEKVALAVLLGDVFNRIAVTNECKNNIINIINSFKDEGIEVATIYGNHDIPRNEKEAFEKSPLEILVSSRLVHHVNKESGGIILNDTVNIAGFDYYDEIQPASDLCKYNILVAHAFYNGKGSGEEHNITTDKVQELGYNMIVLGHDHVWYDNVITNNTLVNRPGAILRGSTHDYNFDRPVGFTIVRNPLKYKHSNVIFAEIEVKPFSDVISSRIVSNKTLSIYNIEETYRELVSRLEVNIETTGRKNSIIQRLQDSDIKDSVKASLMQYFQEAGIVS